MTAPHAPHPANVSGRPVNPDTGSPMPSPSPAQLALVDELLGKLGRRRDADDLIAQALVEAVVRQHGRTLRACIADARQQAEQLDEAARRRVDDGTGPGCTDPGKLAAALSLSAQAGALRAVMLRGDA